jgi:hypothetical protein
MIGEKIRLFFSEEVPYSDGILKSILVKEPDSLEDSDELLDDIFA